MSISRVTVSIITPVFNSEQYIEGTIQSVLMQKFTNWELLLIDGGSDDRSITIINHYSELDARVKLLVNKDDKGPAHARYTGIKAAIGKYIAFLDADDLWHPDKLQIQISQMESGNLDFTYTLCRELQKDGRRLSILLPTNKSFTYRQYLRKRGIYALTVVIRRDLLTDDIISIWNKDAYDDTIWWLLLLAKGVEAFLVPYDLASYRLSNNQLSSRRLHTISKVYGLYNKLPGVNRINKQWYFLNYLLNSAIRHFKLKLFPKQRINDLTIFLADKKS